MAEAWPDMTTNWTRDEIMAPAMDVTTPSTQEANQETALAPAEPYSSPFEAQPVTTTWAPVNMARSRRFWTAALAAALLLTAGGVGLLYIDDTNNQNANRALTSQNEQLTGRTQNLQTQLTTTQNKLTASETQVNALTSAAEHPTLGIWNVPQGISGPTYYLAAGVPDTFTYHLKLNSTGPMSASILSIHQFGDAVRCVETGKGNTNWCMHHSGSANGWLSVTSITFDFHQAEGCAAYLLVISAAGPVTVTPDISVTYNPASSATGACA
jgi:hypothetical protein